MLVKKMIITPAIAKDYLDRCNTDNYRKPIPNVVARYADDMSKGRWTETTATIAFCENGILADGQNRLLAIVKSGKSIMMNVMQGVDDSVAHDPNQDRGSARKLSTTLYHAGYKNANIVASSVRFLFRIAIMDNNRSGNCMISDCAVIDILNSMPEDFVNCINIVGASKTLKQTSTPSCLSVFFWLATCDNQSLANIFIDVMSKKTDGNAFCAANCIREQLVSMRSNTKCSEMDVLNLLLSAFKSFCSQKDSKLIRKTLQLSLTFSMQSEIERVKYIVDSSKS